MRLATVRVRDDYAPQGFKIINESDLNEFHLLWPDQSDDAPAANEAPRVLRPGEIVSVEGILDRGIVLISADNSVAIEPVGAIDAVKPLVPADWSTLHWKTQVKLAKEIGFEGEPTPDEARAFLAASGETATGAIKKS